MRDHLLIHVNGRPHLVRGARSFQPLSSFLRYDLRQTGTKVVCAEGDCGSCTVLLGRVAGDQIVYQPVTCCIQFLWQLDATHIITIEGLKYDGRLNPIQEAMARCHGTQCGFCTPGFVVAMHHALQSNRPATADRLRSALVGNLCRCTGYEPIIRAGVEVDSASICSVDALYPPPSLLPVMREADGDEVRITDGRRIFFKPVTLSGAAEFKGDHSTCVPVAGGTDVGVQINKQLRDPDVVMSLAGLPEFRRINVSGDTLRIGGLVTLAELERVASEHCPELGRMLQRHGSPLIRNAGTLAGNIANGSPIGDALPALYVLNAEIELYGRAGSRRVNLNDFFTGYRATVMTTDELIARVHLPLPLKSDLFRVYKVSKRHDLDISSFMAAVWARVRPDNIIAEIRIAYGGVGPTIIRARRTEQYLTGQPLTMEAMIRGGEIARSEITPISDVRGSASFRSQLTQNILQRFCAEAGADDDASLIGSADGNGEPH